MKLDTAQPFTHTTPVPVKHQAETETSSPAPDSSDSLREGIRVSLSEVGIQRSKSTDKNADIDESDLPNGIKEILKMIRELKRQIAEKMAELQAAMADDSGTPEERQIRLGALQSSLATLQGALSTANANLIKAMKDSNLSSEQMTTAVSLSMN
ncbi:hypothetical protein HW090_01850 [Pseudomonas sp. ABC1]|uniref:hypothetical protein n=1 Tax=Pseudomonas sp. ABC1 TaxID=2748080 RepID=UPI0015C36312|nr:hypothetical protein [Pseudomonas sp. ABC1]QLF92016.1 hypothetical protein HW090_01850 [Pseudomonas sp. ABC1]